VEIMRVLCAWCLKDGKPKSEALIGEREPRDDTMESHGLCADHRKQVEQEIAEYRQTMKRLQEKVDP
jgi:hypothetical protein